MNTIKKIGKMMVTLSIIATAIYILVEHTKEWPATIVLVCFLVVWVQLMYHLFKVVKLSDKGIVFGSSVTEDDSSDMIEKLSKRVEELSNSNKELLEKIDKVQKEARENNKAIEATGKRINELHPAPSKMTFDELMGLQIFVNNIDTIHMTYSNMGEGGPYDSFCSDVAFAKKNKVKIGDSKNYRKILNVFQNAICNHLIVQLTSLYTDGVNSFENTIKRALEQYPYSKTTLLAVRDDLIEDRGKRSQCTLLFDEMINKLDRMY